MTITTFTRFCAAVFTFQMYSQIVLTTVLLRLGQLGLDWLYFIYHWRIYTIPIGGFLTYNYGDSSVNSTTILHKKIINSILKSTIKIIFKVRDQMSGFKCAPPPPTTTPCQMLISSVCVWGEVGGVGGGMVKNHVDWLAWLQFTSACDSVVVFPV